TSALPPSDSYVTANPPALPPFPTRRSSDLVGDEHDRDLRRPDGQLTRRDADRAGTRRKWREGELHHLFTGEVEDADRAEQRTVRSEEHTSELQSRVDLVCRLLLEKKKHIMRQELKVPLHSMHAYGRRACERESPLHIPFALASSALESDLCLIAVNISIRNHALTH